MLPFLKIRLFAITIEREKTELNPSKGKLTDRPSLKNKLLMMEKLLQIKNLRRGVRHTDIIFNT